MKKRWVIVLALVGLMVVIGIVALVVADRKFAVRRSPAISHASFVGPETRVHIAVWPGQAEETLVALIDAAVPEKQRPSSWVLRRLLPNEVAILMEPNVQAGVIGVTAFVNEQRLGPVIRDAVNGANIAKSVPSVRWAPEGMVAEKRGVLTLRGEVPIDATTTRFTREFWPEPPPAAPLPLEGGHTIEVVLDNRDGGTFTTLSALELLKSSDGTNNPDFYVRMLRNVSWVRVSADSTGPGEMALTCRLEPRPDVEDDFPGSLQLFLDMGIAQGRQALEAKGATLTGSSRIEGKTVIGEYTITGLEKLAVAQEDAGGEAATGID